MFTLDAAVWLIVLWLSVVGAAVGSFLNVVVYRLPLGISLVYPPSRCPQCGKAIRWYDNVPVLGWIALRGRCRECGNPIAARYPIVEAITAAMFGLMAAIETPHLQTIYPYHLLLLCTLLCAGLIDYDGHRPPVRLFIPALILGSVAPLFWPELRLLSMWPTLQGTLKGVVDGLAGLVAGSLLGGIAWGSLRAERPIGLTLGLVSVGLFLSFPAVAIVAMLTACVIAPQWLPKRVSPSIRIPPTLSLGACTLIWIVWWEILASR